MTHVQELWARCSAEMGTVRESPVETLGVRTGLPATEGRTERELSSRTVRDSEEAVTEDFPKLVTAPKLGTQDTKWDGKQSTGSPALLSAETTPETQSSRGTGERCQSQQTRNSGHQKCCFRAGLVAR